MSAASRTPARSNCIGTRTFTVVGPFKPVVDSSASTSTRRYFARVFTVAPATLPECSPTVAAGANSRAEMRRSASSALILPAASISRIWRRFSFIALLHSNAQNVLAFQCLKNANQNLVPFSANVHVSSPQARQDAPEDSDNAPDGRSCGDGDRNQNQEDQRRKQDHGNPQQEQR